jgi:acetyltransferase-like isoleucine patch superfamily enzyme
MKCKIPIEKHELAYYSYTHIFKTMRRSARQHGYHTIWGAVWFTLWAIVDYILHIAALLLSPTPGMRIWLQRRRGVKIGKNVQIGPFVALDYVFPNFVAIGDGVSIAGWNYILTHVTPLEYHRNDFDSYVAPVRIEKNAWIAIGAMILPGVTIGEGAVVAAGSLVSRDVAPHTMVAGVPAQVVKHLRRYEGSNT